MVELAIFILSLNLSEIWEFKSPRSLGMGGVATTLEEPQTSFFFNPAGMYKTKSLDIVDLGLYSTYHLIADSLQMYQTISPAISAGKDKREVLKKIKESFGKVYGFESYAFPNFALTVKNVSFGLGILSKVSVSLLPQTPSNVNVDVGISTSVQPVLGGAVSFMDDTLRVGLSFSPIKGFGNTSIEIKENEVLSGNITAVFPGFIDPSKILSGDCRYPLKCDIGFGGFNFGVIFIPLRENFSFGIDIRDVLDVEKKTTLDIGASFKDKISKINYGVYLDFQDLLFAQSYDKSLLKRTFAGTELSIDLGPFKRFFSLYFGIGQMQLSFAFELNLKFLSLFLGTYGRELGAEVGGISARYYFFKLSI